jgi:hypothetical protein
MPWWKRVKVEKVGRELELPKVDAEKLQAMKLTGVKQMSRDDRAMVELLKDELTASGVLDRQELPTFRPIDADGDRVFREAGEQGTRTTKGLPTYDSELDEEISSGSGGENLLLDGIDDYEDAAFDVYETLKDFNHVDVNKNKEDDSLSLRLPDGSVIKGRVYDK